MAGLWAASRAVSSGDLWVALGCGRYILGHGVGRIDPFSFTSPPGSWVNQNWLSHVLFTLIHRAAGLAGLGIWRAAVSVAIVWLAADTAMALGATPLLAMCASIGIALTGRPFFDTRPNLHTVLLAAILLRWLVGIERRRGIRALWPAPALMILWANLHGGFLYGVIAVGAATTALVVEYYARGRTAACWPSVQVLPFVTLAAALVSPYFLTNLSHPWEISVGPAAKHWRGVTEWRPPFGEGALMDPGVRAFWIIVGGTVLCGGIAFALHLRNRKAARGDVARAEPVRARPDAAPLGAVALVSLLLALTSRRFIPLFAVASLPWLAAALTRFPSFARARAPALAWAIAAVVLTAASSVEIAHRLFIPNGLWPASEGWAARLVRADEQPQDAVRYLIGSGTGGRVFTNWTWGGYLLSADPFDRDHPLYRIYLDGRAQAAYPVAISKDYVEAEGAASVGMIEPVRSFLDRYGIEVCVLDKRDGGLLNAVTQMSDWTAVYGDDQAIVAVRSRLAPTLRPGPFPDEAIARASQALRIRTGAAGNLDVERGKDAFEAAFASVAVRPTTIGVTEMTRIALATPGETGATLRARAAAECDRILTTAPGTPLYQELTIYANTAQCRSVLAKSAQDIPSARHWRDVAVAVADRADRLVAGYLR